MIHIYEIDSGRGELSWEVWQDIPGQAWADKYVRSLQNDNEYQLFLDICRAEGVDFVIHTLEEYDEYHVALPSV
jgi:hypothetical protein